MREKFQPWIAAIFCAALCLITIVADVALSFRGSTPGVGSQMAFFSFLPMCFFFVGEFAVRLQKENQALRSRVDELAAQLNFKTSEA